MNKILLEDKVNESIYLFGKKDYKTLSDFLKNKNYSKIFVLVDNNTDKFCFSYFQNQILNNIKLNKLFRWNKQKHQ